MALRIGEILVEKGIITPVQLEKALAEQKQTKKMLGNILIAMGLVTERKFLQVLSEQQGIPFVELKDTAIDQKAIKVMPPKFVWHYKIMPIHLENNVLTVAMSNPFEVWPIDDLETHLGLRVEKVLAASSDITETARKYYGVGADTIERILSQEAPDIGTKTETKENKVEDLEKMSEDASVIRLVNQILQQAINDRATDIHIEAFREELSLRYRVDGALYDVEISDAIRHLYLAIVSRIKVMSGLDIVERRLPQDGRAKVKIGNKEYELRVSVIPALYGENIVVRILPTTMLFDVAHLGMSAKDLDSLEQLILKHHGIIFVTGPTGSGKTTTLYACLSKLNTRQRKIVTIEDPVEYELKGVTQTQVNPRIGLTFAAVLRSMLRHDPDVMMVGEVRDFETADITIQTSLTGHLVFSTLHTNDAATGVTRLIDIGVEPFLIASSVEAFIAQRLVRLVCGECKENYKLDQMSDVLKQMVQGSTTIYRGRGCKSCGYTGYAGRSGIYEILLVNEEIKKLILQKTSADVIRNKAIQSGMRTLQQSGWEKVAAGLTTPEEILRVIQ
ncbi:MAG: Flp pilus assembly complex ATPase component TadA [Candidatus Omnitrophica bacterium]|nr:Flp pilus assembly complex ATPase component TadA [Candidatus Omnitrophota bacterium]